MKKVMVHPERCVGCMQCMISCATAHSKDPSTPDGPHGEADSQIAGACGRRTVQ